MTTVRRTQRGIGAAAALVALVFVTFVPSARSDVAVRFERLDGFAAPGTPAELNKVGVLQIGPKKAKNVLVLNPGTSASAAYFAPLAKTVVEKTKGFFSRPRSAAWMFCAARLPSLNACWAVGG